MHIVRYKFDNVRFAKECATHLRSHLPSCACRNSLSFHWYKIPYQSWFESYCEEDCLTCNPYKSGLTNQVNITIRLTRPTHTIIDMDFYVARKGHCGADEVECDVCIHRSLGCGAQKSRYCPYNDVCSDIKTQKTDSLIIGLVVSVLIIVCLVVIATCILCKSNRLNSKACCCLTTQNSRNATRRPLTIFAIQLANRGVTRRDGNDNDAYSEDGDPSLAVPPPEYSSLEHLDARGRHDFPDGDLPPSYDEAIRNMEQFKVSISISDSVL